MKFERKYFGFDHLLLALGLSACGAQDTTCLLGSNCELEQAEPASLPPLSERIESLTQDVGSGSSGNEVRTLHEYLTATGYFPSEELAQQDPNWAPLFRTAPARADVFDEQSLRALRAFQERNGIEQTGIVDEATRARMRAPRCGLPEGRYDSDTIEKYNLRGGREIAGTTWLPRTSLTWFVTGVQGAVILPACPRRPAGQPASCTAAQLTTHVEEAAKVSFKAWSDQTNLTFAKATSAASADIKILFDELPDGMPNVLAFGNYPDASTHNITFDQSEDWSDAVTPPTSGPPFDLQDVMMHEIGHILGVRHSAFSQAMMVGSVAGFDRALSVDDTVAVSALYDVWREAEGNGRALDIGVGADGSDADTAPDVWVIGTAAQSGGFEIYKWTGSGYQFATGDRGATAISVSPTDGKPWIVSNNRVYERSSTSATSGTWIQRGPSTNCATDIAAANGGRAWEIGCTKLPGGFNIASYNPSTLTWTTQGPPGQEPSAVRIASEAGGAPWVVANDDAVYKNSTGSSTDWVFTGGFGKDVGAGATLAAGKGYAFVTGRNAGQVYVWNEQDAVSGDADDTANQAQFTFRFFDGNGTKIAVGPDGKPWLVASNNTIWRTTK